MLGLNGPGDLDEFARGKLHVADERRSGFCAAPLRMAVLPLFESGESLPAWRSGLGLKEGAHGSEAAWFQDPVLRVRPVVFCRQSFIETQADTATQ